MEALWAGLCLQRAASYTQRPHTVASPALWAGTCTLSGLLPGQPSAQLIVVVTWKVLRYPRTAGQGLKGEKTVLGCAENSDIGPTFGTGDGSFLGHAG